MKTLMMLLILVLLTACGTEQTGSNQNDIEISVQTQEETLAVGETVLIITLKDASGTPVDGATVHVYGNMDHEGMASVEAETKDSVNGEYHVPFAWSMGGGWIVTVTAKLPDSGGEVTTTQEYFVEAVSDQSIVNRQGH